MKWRIVRAIMSTTLFVYSLTVLWLFFGWCFWHFVLVH